MVSREYVSDELVHWTGRGKSDQDAFRILRTICKEEILRLSFCPNYVNADWEKKSAIVCFTDIPLKLSREHCEKFGRFGIAFKKSNMIGYGANPVFYTTGAHLERIKLIVSSLLERMIELEKDRGWRAECEPYFFNEDETVALIQMTDFFQEYAYKNQDKSDYVTYYQREWRLAFTTQPFAGDDKPHIPGTSCFYIQDGKSFPIFKFAPADVEFIVVPEAFVSEAQEVAKSLGCAVKVYETEVSV